MAVGHTAGSPTLARQRDVALARQLELLTAIVVSRCVLSDLIASLPWANQLARVGRMIDTTRVAPPVAILRARSDSRAVIR